jgi:hypothetical protein
LTLIFDFVSDNIRSMYPRQIGGQAAPAAFVRARAGQSQRDGQFVILLQHLAPVGGAFICYQLRSNRHPHLGATAPHLHAESPLVVARRRPVPCLNGGGTAVGHALRDGHKHDTSTT